MIKQFLFKQFNLALVHKLNSSKYGHVSLTIQLTSVICLPNQMIKLFYFKQFSLT